MAIVEFVATMSRNGGGAPLLAAWPIERPPDWVKRVNQTDGRRELESLGQSVQRGRPFGPARLAKTNREALWAWSRRTVAVADRGKWAAQNREHGPAQVDHATSSPNDYPGFGRCAASGRVLLRRSPKGYQTAQPAIIGCVPVSAAALGHPPSPPDAVWSNGEMNRDPDHAKWTGLIDKQY